MKLIYFLLLLLITSFRLVAQNSPEKNIQDNISQSLIHVPEPNISLTDAHGNSVSLAAMKGKILVLDFWATWCEPCIQSLVPMQQVVEKYKNDPNVKFLFINTK